MSLGTGTRQALWIRHLLEDITGRQLTIHLKCDNQSAVHVATDDTSNKRCRHVEREFFIVNEALHQKKAVIEWIPSSSQTADGLTKNLGPQHLQRLTSLLNHR